MATNVFISYCRENRPDADKVCDFLEQNKISCWIAPRNIPGGMEWPEAIVEGIKGSRIMLVLLSVHTQRSKQIGRELTLASDNDLTVITVRLDNVPAPDRLQYFTSNLQWIDAFGECFGSGMAKLLATLRFQLGQPQTPIAANAPSPVKNKSKWTAKKVAITVCFGFLALGLVGYFADPSNRDTYRPASQDTQRISSVPETMEADPAPNPTRSSPKTSAPVQQKAVPEPDAAANVPDEPQTRSAPPPVPIDTATALGQSTAGTWAGTYVCGGFTNQAQLSLASEGNGGLHGILQFNALPQPGSYYVRGSINPADNSMYLKYTGWLYRPPGDWIPLDIQAQVDVANGVMQGRMSSGICTAFALRKIQ